MSDLPGWVKAFVIAPLAVGAFVPHREPAIESDDAVWELMQREASIAAAPDDPLAGVNPGAILTPRQRPAWPEVELEKIVATRTVLNLVLDSVLRPRYPKYRVVAHFLRDGEPRCAVFAVQRSVQDERWYAKSTNSSSCSTWW